MSSLRPDDRRGRNGTSRSRSRDERDPSRSRSAVRFDSPPKSSSKLSKTSKSTRFADEDDDDDDSPSVSMPTMPETFAGNGDMPRTDIRRPSAKNKSSSSRFIDEETSSTSENNSESDSYPEAHQATRQHKQPFSRDGRSPMSPGASERKSGSGLSAGLAYGDGSNMKKSRSVPYPEAQSFMPQWPSENSSKAQQSFPGYSQPEPYRYADPPDKLTYTTKPHTSKEYRQTAEPLQPKLPNRSVSFSKQAEPYAIRSPDERKPSKSSRLSVGGPSFERREPSPARGHGSRSDRLSVSTGHADHNEPRGGAPPASPLLETYHGTYQSISPMPSPIMVPENEDVDDVPPIRRLEKDSDEEKDEDNDSDEDSDDEDIERETKKPSQIKKSKLGAKGGKKRVTLYDAEGDAKKLASALNHHDARPGPLIDILPELTHDQLLALRDEYKKQVKIHGKGVNIAKQIKSGTTGNFSKVCYATALGRWESEAYWANFWYQAHSSNRELLIEALMGRCNSDVREIKESFRDKRYQDDMSLCMQKELKPDKFRAAVLMALEGQRQEETDVWPAEYRNKDAEILYRALKSREGGESAMLKIVVTRSDNHLRQVLKVFERVYEENFARAALKKSTNLVVSDRNMADIIFQD